MFARFRTAQIGLGVLLACVFTVVLLALPALLYSQGDTVVTVHDKTGIFGAVIDNFWTTVGTLITSAAVWLWARYSDAFRNKPEPVKWLALYAFSLLYNLFAAWVGSAPVDPLAFVWGEPALVSAGMTGAAAMIYKLAGHQVPKAAAGRPSARV